MGIARWTNIVRDGLVFGHDTGYGVANNAVATRFYKGKPATNLVPSGPATWTGDFQRQHGHVETITYSKVTNYKGRENAHKLYVNPTSTNEPYADFAGQYHKSGGSAVGDVYHLSFDYFVEKGLNTPNLSTVYANGYKLPNSNSAATLGNATEVVLDDGWTRYSRKVTIITAGNTHFRCGCNSLGEEMEVYIDNFQIELQSNATPFVDGTRSNTGGFIDLKRSTNINLSSVSFNSTGQPIFDGTDDEINTGITTQLTDFSCVVIFKDGGSAAWGRLVDKQYTTGFFISSYFASVGNNYVGAGVIEPSSPHGQALKYDDTKYNYFVVTRSGGTHTIYLNGSTNNVQKTNGSTATLSSTEMAIGAWNGSTATQRYTGEIQVVKLYNKELTAAEIQQDFEAYKNRFNL